MSRMKLFVRMMMWTGLVCMTMGATRCEDPKKRSFERRMEQTMEEDKKLESAKRFVEPGESVRFAFMPDGVWHPSPYMILHNQRIKIELAGEARVVGPNVVSFRIGEMLNLVSDKTDFLTSDGGSVWFRVPPDRMHLYKKEIEVEITNVPR